MSGEQEPTLKAEEKDDNPILHTIQEICKEAIICQQSRSKLQKALNSKPGKLNNFIMRRYFFKPFRQALELEVVKNNTHALDKLKGAHYGYNSIDQFLRLIALTKSLLRKDEAELEKVKAKIDRHSLELIVLKGIIKVKHAQLKEEKRKNLLKRLR
jgi:hypothetical protein